MLTFGLMKGLPIIEAGRGRIIGTVSDLFIIEDKVSGLLINKKAFLKRPLFLDIDKVVSAGPDGVIVEKARKLEQVTNREGCTLFHQSPVFGRMVLSKKGESLGLLSDVYFLEELGTIVGYEISDGFFSDLQDGKKVIKTDCPLTIGKDAIIVNDETT